MKDEISDDCSVVFALINLWEGQDILEELETVLY